MITRIVLFLIIVPIYVFTAIAVYLAFEGGDVLSYSKSTVYVQKNSIILIREYEKGRDCKTLSASHILQQPKKAVDTVVAVDFKSTILNSQQGQRTIAKLRSEIPFDLEPGKYQVRSDISFRCNLFQWRTVRAFSNIIEIK